MSPDKRHGREAARRRAAQQAARAEAQRRKRRMQRIAAGAVAVIVVVAVVLAMIPTGDDDDTAVDTFDDSSSTTEPTTTPTIADEPTDVAFPYGTGECAPDRKPETRPETFAAAPQQCLTEGADYKAVVGTSEGTFTVDLLEQRAPGTVNNFVELARWGWFDGDDFHRVEPGFVIQGGDPVGNPPGTGNPGYSIADELPDAVSDYVPGAVAMANSGPNTNGSQWFVCIDCSVLPTAGYSLFGQVTDGIEVVEAINTRQGGEVTIVAIEILEDPLATE